jgi:hypothetical protein
MAEKIISPGVFTKEIDQTFLPAAIADIGACLIGPTVKGQAGIPTIITSYSDFQQKFGDTFKSGSSYYQYLTSHTAKEYLKHNNTLTVVRVLAGSYGGASATISSSVDGDVVGFGAPNLGFAKGTINFGPASSTGSSFGNGSGIEISSSAANMWGAETNISFILTGSGTAPNLNTSTLLHVTTGSGLLASQFRDVINNSSSLHGLTNISASSDGDLILGITSSRPGNHTTIGVFGESQQINGTLTFFTSSFFMTASVFTGDQTPGSYLKLGGGASTFKTPFKLHTLSDGAILNSVGPTGSNNILLSGSKDNLRWEISSLNKNKGTFTLAIRRGNDNTKRKQVLETFSNINLDPATSNYIAKAIGTQYYTVATDENSKPFLQLVGDYPRKSKYVRVEVIEQTADYLDDNGDVRVGYASASLPAFHSGSNSGSFAGSFSGGSDGTEVSHPHNFYENISENNSQGLDPSNDGGASGYNDYIQALNILANQDDYDINLILAPGIINSIHTSVASKIIDVCEDRQDCFAIIDPVEYNKNVGDATEQAETRDSNYASMYWPWIKVPDNQTGTTRWVPPSVTVAGVYAFNDKVAHEWFAPAGLNRGTIDIAIQAERKLTQADRDSLYDSNVNPIATFPGQGVTIFGQKTLQKKSSALDRVNVRRLLIKVKKFIASSSRFLVFEQNNTQTRQRFLSIANPFLNQVKSQSGLSEFRVVMDATNNTPDTIDRNQLIGQLFLQPTRTAEFIVLDFSILPTGASFPE